MVKVILDAFIKTVAVEFENTPKEEVESLGIVKELPKNIDRAFGSIYTKEVETGLKEICKAFGAKYPGCSFKFWIGKSDRYIAAGPSIYNNGQGIVLEWGGEVTKLSGDLIGTPVGSTLKVKVGESPSYRMTISVSLEHDGTEEGRNQAQDDWENCDTWEEAASVIKMRLRVPPREEIFAKDRELMVLSSEMKEKNGRVFWIVNCADKDKELGKFQLFLPDEANPQVGTKFSVNSADKCYVIRGDRFYSSEYLSLGQFSVDDVITVNQIEKDRKFGGWNLHTDKGIVSANSQFNRWYEKEGFPVIGENGFGKIILTVLKIDKQGKRSVVLLDIKVEGRKVQGLAALLGRKPANTEVPEDWGDEPAAKGDTWETDPEPEVVPQGLSALIGPTAITKDSDDWV